MWKTAILVNEQSKEKETVWSPLTSRFPKAEMSVITMDFICYLLKTRNDSTSILNGIYKLSKVLHVIPLTDNYDAVFVASKFLSFFTKTMVF